MNTAYVHCTDSQWLTGVLLLGLSDCSGTIFGIITPPRLERNNPPVWLGSGIIRNNFIVQFTFLLDIRLILSDHGMGNEIADRIGRDHWKLHCKWEMGNEIGNCTANGK